MRFHPFALLASMVCCLVVVLIMPHPGYLLAAVLTIAYLLLGWGKRIALAALFYVPVNALIGLAFYASSGSAYMGGFVFIRLILVGLVCVPLTSLSELDFVRALQTSKAPRGLTLCILISLRYMRIFTHQAHQILVAKHFVPGASLSRALIPLMVQGISCADDLANALALRGYTLHGAYTVYKPLHMHIKDAVYVFAHVALCATAIFY